MTVYHEFPYIARIFPDKIVKAFSAHRFRFGKPFLFESSSKESPAGKTKRNRRKWMQSARHAPHLPASSVKHTVSNCHSGDNASSTPPRTRTATRLLSRSAAQLRSSDPPRTQKAAAMSDAEQKQKTPLSLSEQRSIFGFL